MTVDISENMGSQFDRESTIIIDGITLKQWAEYNNISYGYARLKYHKRLISNELLCQY